MPYSILTEQFRTITLYLNRRSGDARRYDLKERKRVKNGTAKVKDHAYGVSGSVDRIHCNFGIYPGEYQT